MGDDSGAFQTSCQFSGEQNIAQLGVAIGSPLTVPLVFVIQIVQSQMCHSMRYGCGVDDSATLGGFQQWKKMTSHLEVAEVVHSEGHLVALSGDLSLTPHCAGVVE